MLEDNELCMAIQTTVLNPCGKPVGGWEELFYDDDIISQTLRKKTLAIGLLGKNLSCHSCGGNITGDVHVIAFGGHTLHLFCSNECLARRIAEMASGKDYLQDYIQN